MSVERCVARLAEAGKISKKAADEAVALWRGMADRAGQTAGSASAEAISALNTAKVMAEHAQARKVAIAQQALQSTKALERVKGHSDGPAAGLMGLLTRDIWETGGENVETKANVVLGELMKRYAPGAEAYSSRLAGLAQDTAGAWRAVGELFGVESGDDVARAAAKGWKSAVDYGVTRAKAGGKMFNVIDDWRLPQFWDANRVKKFEAEFMTDIAEAVRSGGVRLMNKETGAPADLTGAVDIVRHAFKSITTQSGSGGSGPAAFGREMRVFRFADSATGFDAYKRLMTKYGTGQTIHDVMTGYLGGMAREIAFTDLMGPDYHATFRMLHLEATTAEREGQGGSKLLRTFGLQSAAASQRTFDFMTGKLSVPQSEMMAGLFGGARSWLAASQLGSAVIPAVFGDSATSVLSAQFNGMDGMKVISRALGEMMTDPATARMAAARMGLVAHAVSDAALGVKRFQDETFDRNTAGKLATFVIRAQGLQAWTESIKRAFSMEFFAMMAENSGKALNELDEPFRNFLIRYNFKPEEWDVLRGTPQIEERGARFFDMEGVADVSLKERLIGAVLDERQFAVLEPTARVSQLTSGGLQRGTFWGEAARSLMMYKSFPIAMIASHAMRVATRSDLSSKIGYGTALLAYTTIAGAATILAKDVVAGKDPRAVNDWKFLGASVIAGGGTGIFGDLLYSGVTRANTSLAGTLFGPAAAGVDQVGRLVFPAVRSAWEGEEANFGGELARAIKSNMPGSNIWYLRTALNRAVFDQFQMHLDPDYRSSFRRMEQRAKKELGQEFWWGPGKVAPERAPEFGAMIR